MHGAVDLLEGGILVHKTRHPQRDKFGGQLGLRVGGQHHDPRGDAALPQGAHEVTAVHVAQVEIGDQEIRRGGKTGGQSLATITEVQQRQGLETTLQRILQQAAESGGIIDEDKAQRGGGRGRHGQIEHTDVPAHCKTGVAYVVLRHPGGEASP